MTTQKTPEEIKNSLERCGQNAECSKCAYYKKHDILYTCMDSLLPDALALIQQLERERDAAVEELKGYGCTYCKRIEDPDESMCYEKCADFCSWE